MDAYTETKDKGPLFVILMNQSICAVKNSYEKKYACWVLVFDTIKKGLYKHLCLIYDTRNVI